MGEEARQTTLVLDFDKTAAEQNVGMSLIESFAKDDSWRVIDEEYGRGGYGSRIAYRLLGPLLTGDTEAWRAFTLSRHRLDPGLAGLLARARAAGWETEILSDGLDLYIDALLAREALAVEVRASRLVEAKAGGRVETPHMNPRCGRCGTCKTERVEALTRAGRRVVFVGDGFSDRCAAPLAEVIFAKDELAEYLTERDIPFAPFETLDDVARALFGTE